MKNLLQLIALGSTLLTLNLAHAQCGAAGVFINPIPLAMCEGDTAIANFSANGTCSGNYEFQVSEGATLVQPWSTSTVFNSTASSTTLYTVSARCSACPSVVVSDTFSVQVTAQPSVSGITSLCYNNSTTLVASGYTGTIGWYDAGGNQLSSNDTYTTPNLTDSTTYFVQVSSTSSSGTGSILITECGLEGFPGSSSADYIEVSNLYTTPVNTTGWVVAISNSYSNINLVNSILWNLPSTFAPCSMVSKTDVSTASNYWGNNMFWNATSPSWAIVIDNTGNVVDFIAWGWTAAQLASFNPTINGYSITLGTEWTGNGCPLPCSTVGGVAYSYSRTGNSDNNEANDFTCQATSLNVVNPGLSCGWTVNVGCSYPTTVLVDTPPTASNPSSVSVECSADVPAVDVNVVSDEADDAGIPTVTFLNEISDGNTCPETITRTYRVTDTCSNYVDVTHTITVHDVTAPVLDTPPVAVSVQCLADVPAMTDLGWTDNCDGAGTVTGNDISNGNTCPEIITRTWTYTDNCGNTASTSQTITVHDITPPTASNPAPQEYVSLPAPDPSVVTDASDNCGIPSVAFVGDLSDGGFCPEKVIRTYSITDDCGNQSFVTQELTIGDEIPVASFIPSEFELTNLDTEVFFENTSTGAVTYSWDFGDESVNSTAENPVHVFPDDESGGYVVQLIAFSPLGCSDTITIAIQVWEELIYYIPNTFTPDGDEYNQTFQPIFESGFDPFDFNMLIFNRWGEVIFETNNHEIGWDGTYGASGQRELVPQGIYTWKIEFKVEKNDERKMISGHLNVIR